SSTENARAAVVRARARDRAALKRLEKREARIKSQILALSRRQGGSYNGDTGGLLHRPADGPVTSPFGYRTHPIYGYYGLHNGTDFGAGCGSSLWAGESGTVINTYYDEVYGNRLYLAIGKVNGASITLVYNHLSSYAVGQGAHVKRGQVVGYVGSTGWSTGCHLHFTVLRNGEPVDPMGYM
ncbi:M23 family metallopeptidase, partial [Nocardioides caeni]